MRSVAAAALVVGILGTVAAAVYGISLVSSGSNPTVGLVLVIAAALALLLGILQYCQIVLLYKFVRYTYRAYEALLTSAELQRRQEEHTRTIADNSNLSEWAKRIVYREKDYEFLRETIHGAIVRQDWESAEHLIRDVETEFGYHDAAARFREQLEQARRATTEERIAAILARFAKLCDEQKWDQARRDCERLQALFPDDPRIRGLTNELEGRRQEYKRRLLAEYEQAIKSNDLDRAHRLLFALDQYLLPQEAEPLKESARSVFRARLEQIKTRFSIAVSYKQFHNAVSAGEQLMKEFPNSAYAHEIAKMMPALREQAAHEHGAPAAASGARA